MTESDHQVWERLRQGDHEALGELFDRHANAVHAFAFRRTASWSTAEDVVQTTFVTVWRKFQRQPPGPLTASTALPYLLMAAGFECRTLTRTKYRLRGLLDRLPTPDPNPDHAADVARKLDDERQMSAVRRAVAKLPKHERETLELVVWAGLTQVRPPWPWASPSAPSRPASTASAAASPPCSPRPHSSRSSHDHQARPTTSATATPRPARPPPQPRNGPDQAHHRRTPPVDRTGRRSRRRRGRRRWNRGRREPHSRPGPPGRRYADHLADRLAERADEGVAPAGCHQDLRGLDSTELRDHPAVPQGRGPRPSRRQRGERRRSGVVQAPESADQTGGGAVGAQGPRPLHHEQGADPARERPGPAGRHLRPGHRPVPARAGHLPRPGHLVGQAPEQDPPTHRRRRLRLQHRPTEMVFQAWTLYRADPSITRIESRYVWKGGAGPWIKGAVANGFAYTDSRALPTGKPTLTEEVRAYDAQGHVHRL